VKKLTNETSRTVRVSIERIRNEKNIEDYV